jgi:hypothetical protein
MQKLFADFCKKVVTPEQVQRIEKWARYEGEKFYVGDQDTIIENLGVWKNNFQEFNVTLLKDNCGGTLENRTVVIMAEIKCNFYSDIVEKNPNMSYMLEPEIKIFPICTDGEFDEEDFCDLPSVELLKKSFESGKYMHVQSLLHKVHRSNYILCKTNQWGDRVAEWSSLVFNLQSLQSAAIRAKDVKTCSLKDFKIWWSK